MFCSKCGTAIPEDYAFCTKCGSPTPGASPNARPEEPRTTKVRRSRMRTILLVLSLVLVTWLGSAGIAYGVVELTGGGPQGEQGEQGPRGERGPAGSAGESAFGLSSDPALQRLAALWAVERISQQRGESISGAHPQVQACIDYIMDGTGSFVECGFERAE